MAMNIVQESAGPPARSGIQRIDPRPIEAKFDWLAFPYVTEVRSLPINIRGKSLFRAWPASIVSTVLRQRLLAL